MKIAQLKANARGNLIGNYRVLICSFIIAYGVPYIINNIFSMINGDTIVSMVDTATGGLTMTIPAVITIIVELIVSILGKVFFTGIYREHLDIATDKQPKFTDTFWAFKNRPDRSIIAGALVMLIEVVSELPGFIMFAVYYPTEDINMIVASIVVIILGIVLNIYLSIKFSLTFIIIADDSEISAIDAMKKSAILIKGHAWQMVGLKLSFIPMELLGIISLCIGFIWIIPYINQTEVAFYRSIV